MTCKEKGKNVCVVVLRGEGETRSWKARRPGSEFSHVRAVSAPGVLGALKQDPWAIFNGLHKNRLTLMTQMVQACEP